MDRQGYQEPTKTEGRKLEWRLSSFVPCFISGYFKLYVFWPDKDVYKASIWIVYNMEKRRAIFQQTQRQFFVLVWFWNHWGETGAIWKVKEKKQLLRRQKAYIQWPILASRFQKKKSKFKPDYTIDAFFFFLSFYFSLKWNLKLLLILLLSRWLISLIGQPMLLNLRIYP